MKFQLRALVGLAVSSAALATLASALPSAAPAGLVARQSPPDLLPLSQRSNFEEPEPEIDEYDGTEAFSRIHPRQTSTTYEAITIKPTCYPRLKLQTLQANRDQWSLFILALSAYQKVTESSSISYYQISGIHGAPKIPWQMPLDGEYDYSKGYCTHNSPLFSSWHRPYLLLFEQVLLRHAKNQANKFGTAGSALRNRMLASADKLRLPYWDWSDPVTRSDLPSSCRTSTISILIPLGTTGTQDSNVKNPLFAYTFLSKANRDQYFPAGNFRNWDSTRRRPNSAGVSNNDEANAVMQNGFSGRRAETYSILTSRTTHNSFNSAVENLHNGIHVNMGGDRGHMTYLDVSSFDPIFWMHHNNIERLYAIWQALRPGRYLTVDNSRPGTETFALQPGPGVRDSLTTPLHPFRHPTSNAFWTSNDVRDVRSTWRYGYGFAEVPCEYRSGKTNEQLRVFTAEKVNRLYGPTAVSSNGVGASDGTGLDANTAAGFTASTPDGETNDNTKSQPGGGAGGKKPKPEVAPTYVSRVEYVLALAVDQMGLNERLQSLLPGHGSGPSTGGSYTFTAFLLDQATNHKGQSSSELQSSPNFLGLISSFLMVDQQIATSPPTGSNTPAGGNSFVTQKPIGKYIRTIPITEPLLAKPFLSNLDHTKPSEIENFLTEKLFWRLELASSTGEGEKKNIVLDIGKQGLASVMKIAVFRREVKFLVPIDPSSLPEYGERECSVGVTKSGEKGANGGLRKSGELSDWFNGDW